MRVSARDTEERPRGKKEPCREPGARIPIGLRPRDSKDEPSGRRREQHSEPFRPDDRISELSREAVEESQARRWESCRVELACHRVLEERGILQAPYPREIDGRVVVVQGRGENPPVCDEGERRRREKDRDLPERKPPVQARPAARRGGHTARETWIARTIPDVRRDMPPNQPRLVPCLRRRYPPSSSSS